MYQDIFIQAGLTENEAIIYEYLLNSGQSTAGDIIKNTPIKRGLTYNVLGSLKEKGLIEEKSELKIAVFSPNHPEKLREYVEKKGEEANKAKNILEANLPAISSAFNLITGKPGVRYFEGLEGIKEVMADSLTSKEVIYSYTDIEAAIKYIPEENKKYIKKRQELNVKKRNIFIDSEFVRNYFKDRQLAVSENRFIDHQLFPFNSAMQIYDGKVSYLTLSEKKKIGIIILDDDIYNLHKSVFEHNWTHAKPLEDILAVDHF